MMTIEKHRNLLWLYFIIAIVPFFLYFDSLGSPFIFDDYTNIVRNPDIKNIHNLKTKLFYKANQIEENRNHPTRPLTFLTFTIDYYFWGLSPAGFRLFNVGIHIGVSLLIFMLTRKLFYSIFKTDEIIVSFFVALVFAVHPMNTDAVTYISNRSDALATFFYLLALFSFIKITEGNHLFPLLSIMSFILALASKEIAITFPVVIFLYDFFFISDLKWHDIKRRRVIHLMYWGSAVVFLLLYRFFFGQLGFMGKDVGKVWNSYNYFSTQLFVVLRYIQLLLIPVGQSIDHMVMPMSLKDYKVLASIMIWIFIFCGMGWMFHGVKNSDHHGDSSVHRENKKLILFSILWFLITLSVTSSFKPIFDAMVERRVYLAGWGFSLGVIIVMLKVFKIEASEPFLIQKNKTFVFVIVLYISILASLTWNRNQLYKDPLFIWEDVLKQYPDQTRARESLAFHLEILSYDYLEKKDFNKAISLFKKAIELNPDSSERHTNLGYIYQLLSCEKEAVQCYIKAIEINPRSVNAYINLGFLHQKKGEYSQARHCYRKALEIDPNHAAVYDNLGKIYEKEGDMVKAHEFYLKAIRIDPDHDLSKAGLEKIGETK